MSRDSRYDPRFVAPQHRDVPSSDELHRAAVLREARERVNDTSNHGDDVDLPSAAASFLEQMKANALKTPEDRARERLEELRRDRRR